MTLASHEREILGFGVMGANAELCAADVVDAVRASRRATDRKACRWLACLNPHSYAVSLEDAEFDAALRDADWLIPDGAGIILASRILGAGIRERVTGSDIFFHVLAELNRTGEFSVFFLGSTEDTLREIRARMERDYPKVRVAGTYSPPFKPTYSAEELDRMIEAVNASAADVLWVSMTAPKQEKWIYGVRGRLDVGFAAAVGAVFDFYTGKVQRSHPAFQRLGLEWLPRLLQQPRRLWRRTFISMPIFLWHVARNRSFRGAGKLR